MRVLVTGATGLIGRHLIAALERESEIVALSRGAAGDGTARWIAADLSSPAFVDALPDRVDAVVHLAQSLHYREFPARATDIFNVNVASTAALLDWSLRAGVRRFVYASAGGVDRPAASALSYYLSTKLAGELLARSYAGEMCVTVLRFFFVYGRGQRRSMLIPRLVDAVRSSRPITLAGEHGIRINPVHVDDAVAAVRRTVIDDRPGDFDIAGPEVLTMRQVGEAIASRLGVAAVFTVEDRAAPDLVGDVSRMAARLVPPHRPFSSGVEDVI